MKTLAMIFTMLLSLPALSAQVFPAATNRPNTFFAVNTFKTNVIVNGGLSIASGYVSNADNLMFSFSANGSSGVEFNNSVQVDGTLTVLGGVAGSFIGDGSALTNLHVESISVSDVPVSVKAFAGQATNLFEVQSSAGAPMASISAVGSLNLSSSLSVGGAITTTNHGSGYSSDFYAYKPTGNDGGSIFIGYSAGNVSAQSANSWEASYNIGIGNYALVSLTTGYANSAFGHNSLQSASTGYGNTGFGNSALKNTSNGYNNVAVGNSALAYNIGGHANTAIGYQSMLWNTTGNNCTAFGSYSLWSNQGGLDNVAVGGSALYSNTNGYSNVAVGPNAMYSNLSGNRNVGIGDAALFFNTTGEQLVAIGDSALEDNTSGNSNTAVGHGTLVSNTVASFNTAVGESAAYWNLGGSNNTAIGANALQVNTYGNNNTAVGRHAGYVDSDGTQESRIDQQMTFIGAESSRSGVANTTPLTNSTAIGYGAMVDESHKVVIGDDRILRTVLKGNVGIGTTTPTAKLDVTGGIVADSVTATNGCVLNQLPWIPTNSIPASVDGITNYVLCNLSNTVAGSVGGPHYVATNHSASGSFIILKPTLTQTTWP